MGSNTDPHVRHDWKTRDNILQHFFTPLFGSSESPQFVQSNEEQQPKVATEMEISMSGIAILRIVGSIWINSHSKMMMILKWDDLINVWDSDIII